ncbi:cyclopropane fatty acyl phospholipid synthase [Thermoproteota archaeon]
MNAKQTIHEYLSLADIKINGDRPWDIQVHNPRFYSKVLAGGTLAFGETYMDGWWDCKQIDELINRICRAKIYHKVKDTGMLWNVLKAKVINMQNRSRAYEVGKKHYDIGNDLFKLMLDKRMNYSCGYWKTAKTLDEAQEAKLDLICRKIGLKKGMTVLDIGCGWGGFAQYAAKKYKVKVLGITISKEQAKLARERCKGLDVEIRLQDYRQVRGEFDRVVSVGMIEHVGYKNYRTYMKVAHRCLKPDGIFLLHTLGKNISVRTDEPWMVKYIFPNGMCPSAKQLTTAAEQLFVLEDWHTLGVDYEKTLLAWHKNFTKNWDKLSGKYDQRFYRMWVYYLLINAGSFRARDSQLWQIVLAKKGVDNGYESVR